MFSDVKFVTIC